MTDDASTSSRRTRVYWTVSVAAALAVAGTAGVLGMVVPGHDVVDVRDQLDLPVTFVADADSDGGNRGQVRLNADGSAVVEDVRLGAISSVDGLTCVRGEVVRGSASGTWRVVSPGWIAISLDGGETAIGAHRARFGELDWTRIALRDCNKPPGGELWFVRH